ncbi:MULTISPECIES: anaerobic ribonucleoside-triphosphate reductase activating protein [Flavobacterium]|uniref:Pyruvate formate lyase activating enzyme n=2 Tax=Flavobacterium TaxID=237 RepID=A0A328YPS5_9FLAO|nr:MULTISPECIES: anaerobic ribonucleoside-triphosphate reductase activating protein [Flavobacterium]MBM6498181.1 anaerobic ribonucleoside-triphosphate reductase activating protein [Flavobacterium macrobrachii]MEC4050784.1 anaerobic ribonucleoside-triphosphate reductase activating protein [Flavobacterium sp. SUN046]RAR75819.1 pyruvate formate lyase activating enzyme [Flavobacterium aciduliphilum]
MLAKPICNITPFTLLDYPNKSACILWYAGCNMRCLYCYNPEIVLGKGAITFSETISFLKKRKGLLDAVVFSGGECLIHKNIVEQIKEVKALGFLVKIDTNGSNSKIVKQLIQDNLIDYVALDFKALKPSYNAITKSNLFDEFESSFELLLASTIPFEIRTTYHSELISDVELNEMIHFLEYKEYKGNYYIQYFKNNVETLGNLSSSLKINSSRIENSPKIRVVFRN